MRISFIVSLGLMVCRATSLSAQTFVAPPPGFAPGGDDTPINSSMPPAEINRDYGIMQSPPPQNYGMPGLRGGPGASAYPRSIDSVISTEPTPFFGTLMPFPNVWFSAEALIWWTKSNPVPVPLVTDGTSLATGSPVILGDQNMSQGASGGGRFTLGFGFGLEHAWAFEGSYFFLNNGGVSQGVTSDGSSGSALLSFPFYNPTIPGEDSSPIASPGKYAGTAVISTQSQLQGVDLNILRNIAGNGDTRFDVLGGFRYVNLQEDLLFTTNSPGVYPSPPSFFNTFDSFNTQSNFYGAQVGGRATYDNGRWFCNTTAKLAFGDSFQTVSINGGTFTDYLGPYNSAPGAYLSQPSNIGSQTASKFALIPEMNINVGLYLTPWARLTLGYSFLYISSVARPGNQIDRVINPSQASAITGYFPSPLVGVASPTAVIHSSSFWAQGLNLGLELRY